MRHANRPHRIDRQPHPQDLALRHGAQGGLERILIEKVAPSILEARARGMNTLPAYERQLIHRSVIDIASVQSTVTQLLAMSVEQRRALGYMHPGRADVIGAGGIILERVLQRTPVRSVLVSEHDILDGIAWSLADPAAPDAGNQRSQ